MDFRHLVDLEDHRLNTINIRLITSTPSGVVLVGMAPHRPRMGMGAKGSETEVKEIGMPPEMIHCRMHNKYMSLVHIYLFCDDVGVGVGRARCM